MSETLHTETIVVGARICGGDIKKLQNILSSPAEYNLDSPDFWAGVAYCLRTLNKVKEEHNILERKMREICQEPESITQKSFYPEI